MAVTTQTNWRAWANVNASTPSDARITTVLGQAEDFVSGVLNLDLEDSGSDVTEYYDGTGTEILYLKRRPINAFTSVSYLSDVSAGVGSYTAFDTSTYMRQDSRGRLIRTGLVDFGFNLDDGVWPLGHNNIRVIYQGGWTTNTLPDDLQVCIYQVASRLLQTADGSTEDIRSGREELRALVLEMAGRYRRQGI